MGDIANHLLEDNDSKNRNTNHRAEKFTHQWEPNIL